MTTQVLLQLFFNFYVCTIVPCTILTNDIHSYPQMIVVHSYPKHPDIQDRKSYEEALALGKGLRAYRTSLAVQTNLANTTY